MADTEKTLILGDETVRNKVIRMAYEILENNFSEKSIVIAGIDGQGFTLAKMLVKELKKIAEFDINLIRLNIDKTAPETSEISISEDLSSLKRKSIIIVDDVLNTGKIISYSMKPFLGISVRKIEVAVLVNRSHLLFPVHANYTGYALSTTLSDHIEVVLGKQCEVYLH